MRQQNLLLLDLLGYVYNLMPLILNPQHLNLQYLSLIINNQAMAGA